MKGRVSYWRALAYSVMMTYFGCWAFLEVKGSPDNKFGIALLFIAAIVAVTAVYCVLSRKD